MNRADYPDSAPWGLVIAAAVGGAALVLGASLAPEILQYKGFSTSVLFSGGDESPASHPLEELLKLIVAALCGIIVTAVHRYYHRDKPLPRSLLQAQVLLCIAGAIVMVIIGNSVARAFGVAGAAGLVRFRTPVEDPKDTTLLFLLVIIGMACGIGLLDVAALGTVFLCAVLVMLDHFGEVKAKQMILSLVAKSADFPREHVNNVLRATVDHYETREVIQGNEAVVKYLVTFTSTAPLGWLSQELMANGNSGLKSVSWLEPPKKGG